MRPSIQVEKMNVKKKLKPSWSWGCVGELKKKKRGWSNLKSLGNHCI